MVACPADATGDDTSNAARVASMPERQSSRTVGKRRRLSQSVLVPEGVGRHCDPRAMSDAEHRYERKVILHDSSYALESVGL